MDSSLSALDFGGGAVFADGFLDGLAVAIRLFAGPEAPDSFLFFCARGTVKKEDIVAVVSLLPVHSCYNSLDDIFFLMPSHAGQKKVHDF